MCQRIMRAVSRVSGLDLVVLRSPTWRRSVAHARAAAAYLLRDYCELDRIQTGQYIGRSEQTVSDLTSRARASLVTGGPIADVIVAAARVLRLELREGSVAPCGASLVDTY
jgi:hypothetical protein